MRTHAHEALPCDDTCRREPFGVTPVTQTIPKMRRYGTGWGSRPLSQALPNAALEREGF
jgi:hypothetical protein